MSPDHVLKISAASLSICSVSSSRSADINLRLSHDEKSSITDWMADKSGGPEKTDVTHDGNAGLEEEADEEAEEGRDGERRGRREGGKLRGIGRRDEVCDAKLFRDSAVYSSKMSRTSAEAQFFIPLSDTTCPNGFEEAQLAVSDCINSLDSQGFAIFKIL